MTKVETVQQMAASATQALTAQIQDWCRFLVIAGRFYKYRFLEQVLIYTQRPTATACASYDLWNSRMRRRIRRGRSGIALLYRGSDGKPALRYVFDVADTVELEDSLSPEPWQYSAKYHAAVTAHLARQFQTPQGKLEDMLISLSALAASKVAEKSRENILLAVKGSGLDGESEDAALGSFAAAATVSLAFLLLARCGYDLDAFFTKEDFAGITNFTTRRSVLALGNTVSDSARVILRQIETAIRDYDAAPPEPVNPAPAPRRRGRPPKAQAQDKPQDKPKKKTKPGSKKP